MGSRSGMLTLPSHSAVAGRAQLRCFDASETGIGLMPDVRTKPPSSERISAIDVLLMRLPLAILPIQVVAENLGDGLVCISC